MSDHDEGTRDVQSLSDSELVERARNGRPEATAELYRRHRDDLVRYVRTLVSDPGTAEDLVADVFLKLLVRIQKGDAPEHPRAYLITAVRNRAVDLHRRAGRLRMIPTEEPVELDPSRGGQGDADLAASVAERELMSAVLNTLSPRHRQVLWRTLVEDRSLGQVADELGINPNAAAAVAHRARRALREQYLLHQAADEPGVSQAPGDPQADSQADSHADSHTGETERSPRTRSMPAALTRGPSPSVLVSPHVFANYLLHDRSQRPDARARTRNLA